MTNVNTHSLQVTSPINSEIIIERPYADPQLIEKILQRSQQAIQAWRHTPLEERMAICRKSLEYFQQHNDDIAEEITLQMGRPIAHSPGEVAGLCERANAMINAAPHALSDITPPAKNNFKRFIRLEPVGAVMVVAPWNYPYLTATNAIYPALLAGNTVLLKHSSQTPVCAERFYEAFKYADLPEGVFQYLHLHRSDALEIMQDSRIHFVAFTGSVNAGREVQRTISQRFIGAGLELGGKDPAYVRSDANLDSSAENIIDGAFFNAGQSCCGIERVYVHESLYDNFLERAIHLSKQYILADPREQSTTLGPVIRNSAADFIKTQINEAISQGAECAVGCATKNVPENYLAPHILHKVNHEMRVMTEETFGPVLGIMPVKSDEEAVALMNDSEYGLTASIWTQDVNATEHIGNQLQTGTVFMNRCDYLDPELVWTGVKNTGHGYSLSLLGYQQLTQAKSFHFKLSS